MPKVSAAAADPAESDTAPGRARGDRANRADRGVRIRRLVATLAILGLAAVATVHHYRWLAAQSALAAEARAHGLAGPELAEITTRMRREGDPLAARLVLAARLFDLEVASREPGSPASAERLLATRELAREALREAPASWQAAMLLGATVSLERSRNRDARLYSLARDWERPLVVAGELAPAELQPRRLLAAAYLEVWPALTTEKRVKVEGLLREAFLEPHTFDRLYGPWVAIAGSLERAATLLPDRPLTFKRLAATAFERKSWSEYAALSARHREGLLKSLERDLAAAGKAVDGGNLPSARRHYSTVLAEAPVDAASVELVERALARLPPGPASESQVRAADAWLAWAQPLCLVRTCPLSPAAMGRLASLAGTALSGDDAAFATLAAENRNRADLLERRSDELWSEAWAPFVTLKAKQQAARQEIAAARETLLTAHRSFRVRLAWRVLAERIAAVGVVAGPPLSRDLWEASDWWFERGASRLDLLPSRAASALWLDFPKPVSGGAGGAGALLEIQWDGRALLPLALAAGEASLRLPVAVMASEPHLLEVRVRDGDLRPAARVRLE